MLDSAVRDRLSEDALFDGIEHLLKTVSSPALVRAFDEIEAAPAPERAEMRRRLASVESLRALGVPVPEELRVCLRSFEDPERLTPDYDLEADIFNGPIESETTCISLGVIVCVSWGVTVRVDDLAVDPTAEPAAAENDDDDARPPAPVRVIGAAPVPGGSNAAEMRASLKAIAEYTQSPPFRAVLHDLYALPHEDRGQFVRDVVLNRSELARRGASPPDGMLVQRSAFADRRPSLFCVSQKLGGGPAKVTVTFDSANKRPE